MTACDNWLTAGEAWRVKRKNALLWALDAFFFAAVYVVFFHMTRLDNCDIRMHANIAGDFDFADLHSITSRVAYPLWHIIVSALYQLGLPLYAAAAAVTALFKTASFIIAQCLLTPQNASKRERVYAWLLSLVIMTVTAIRISSVNPKVYLGVGSPNVWHNPTQVTVTAILLICVPYLMHIYRDYELCRDKGKLASLSWGRVILLAMLLGLCASAKPTFLQGLLPAAFVLFAVEWARRPAQWRFFTRFALAFVPAAGYFLLQYLYYTGVVVEYTSGVELCLSPETLWSATRGMLLMGAFPLLAIICAKRRGESMRSDTKLALLFTVFSVIEMASFRETGLRINHGNFAWAMGNAALLLWWQALRSFPRDIGRAWAQRREQPLRAVGYAVSLGLLAWHVATGVYYICTLMTTNNAF